MRRVPVSRAVPLVAALFAVVVGTDQAAKWLAWRHLGTALINEGGFIALRPGVRAWFADPTIGAVADAVGAFLVLGGLLWLLRRPRRAAVLVGGALVAAGWTSNLLDRFGLHAWSAPGSVRGVVDFIPSGSTSKANVADVWIALGVIVLGVAAGQRWFRRPAREEATPPTAGGRAGRSPMRG